MRDLNLPGLYDTIVRHPDHYVPLHRDQADVGKRLHVLRRNGGWDWAVILRAVSGWRVIAAGTFGPGRDMNADQVSEELRALCMGPGGDGYDRLPPGRYTQLGERGDAHIRRADNAGLTTYCDRPGGPDAVFDTKVKGHATQHCIACDRAYRAEHYGRTPVEARR